MKIVQMALRFVLGAFFIFSALSKFEGIESFEVYLYSSTFLNYDLSTLLARLIIAAELFIGIAFITRLAFYRTWQIALFFISVLSLFLIYQYTMGSEENCHCLGELVEMSPGLSILKNIILLVLLFGIRKTKRLEWKFARVGVLTALVLSLAVPLIVSPPDLFVKGRFDPASHDQEALDKALMENQLPQNFVNGKKLLTFFSRGCKYCKMTSTRIGEVVRRNDIDTSFVRYVFWGDTILDVQPFFDETHSPRFVHAFLETKPYLKITKGRMPLVLLVEDGDVKEEMNYRTFDEKKVAQFLQEDFSEK